MARKKSKPTLNDLAATMAQYAELQDIVMEECSARILEPRENWEDIDDSNIDAVTTTTTESEYDLDDQLFWVTVNCDVLFVKDLGKLLKKKKVLSIKVSYVLTYSYSIEGGPSPKKLNDYIAAFGGINGVLNAWPYLREFVQSTTTRMGLPPFFLPLHRIQEDQ